MGRIEIVDLKQTGLVFRLTTNGVASWSYRYRSPTNGKLLRATIGSYPSVGLAQARKLAGAMESEIAGGIDPGEERRRRVNTASARTFGAVAERYLAEHAARHK